MTQVQVQPAVVLPAAVYEGIMERLDRVSDTVELYGLVLRQLGGLRTKEALEVTGIKSVTGLKGAVKKGELVETYNGRYPEYPIYSIIAYLQKKGYSSEHIRMRIAG